MISTIPVDKLLGMFDDREFQDWSKDEDRFLRQSVVLVGIGVWGKVKPSLNDTHWVYFPEEKYVFYRLTILSNFSPDMVHRSREEVFRRFSFSFILHGVPQVAQPGKQFSIVVEVRALFFLTLVWSFAQFLHPGEREQVPEGEPRHPRGRCDHGIN